MRLGKKLQNITTQVTLERALLTNQREQGERQAIVKFLSEWLGKNRDCLEAYEELEKR